MAKICGISAETLREVARLYARSRASIIFWGMGISQHVHGTDNARCLIALALTTGQIGRPGTGLHPLRGQNNVQGASDAGLIPMVYPDYQSVEKPALREIFETAWGTSLDPERGLTVVEIMDAIHAGTIRGMYIEGENPAMSDPDLHHARQALAKLEHLVVQDLFLTETAFYADVVLPASAFAEKTGTFTNTDRRVQFARPVVPAPKGARQDWWIIQEIARRMGLAWSYDGPRGDLRRDGGIDAVAASHHVGASGARRRRHLPCRRAGRARQRDPLRRGLSDAERARPPRPGQPSPARRGPRRDLSDGAFDRPCPRALAYRAMTRRADLLDALEPEAVAFLSPKELRRLGVAAGDEIRIETRRGAVDLKVRADRNVPEGMVFMPFCYAEAAANLLTNPALDPFGKIPEFKFCAARVSALA